MTPVIPRDADLRSVIAEHSEAEGVSIEQAIWSIYKSMLAKAKAGDVQAAKLLLDRLCDTSAPGRELGDLATRTAQFLDEIEEMG